MNPSLNAPVDSTPFNAPEPATAMYLTPDRQFMFAFMLGAYTIVMMIHYRNIGDLLSLSRKLDTQEREVVKTLPPLFDDPLFDEKQEVEE